MLLVQPCGQLAWKSAAIWVHVEAMAIGPAAAVDEGADQGVEDPCADAARARQWLFTSGPLVGLDFT
jgi:hypothetical protein